MKTPKKSLSDQWELRLLSSSYHVHMSSVQNHISSIMYIDMYDHVCIYDYIVKYSEYIMVSYIHKELCLRGGISSIDYI